MEKYEEKQHIVTMVTMRSAIKSSEFTSRRYIARCELIGFSTTHLCTNLFSKLLLLLLPSVVIALLAMRRRSRAATHTSLWSWCRMLFRLVFAYRFISAARCHKRLRYSRNVLLVPAACSAITIHIFKVQLQAWRMLDFHI